MGVFYFIRTHWWLLTIPAAILILAWILLSKRRRARRQFQEMSRMKRRDEALNEALRNPLLQEEPRNRSEGPMEIQWDDKAVREGEGRGPSLMAELVELSAYSRRRYVYRLDRPIRIGSGRGCQMELPREGVAEAHCEIFLQSGQPCVRTLRGNQTLLKRGKHTALVSTGGAYLKNGDHIQLGTTEIQFRGFRG